MDSKDYEFTGHTSSDDGGADIDGIFECYQYPEGTDFNSMGQLGQASDADRAVIRGVQEAGRGQDGMDTYERYDELMADAPGQVADPEQTDSADYIDDDIYHTSGEWQRRQWKDTDNTGGEGVPSPPEMPIFVRPGKPKPQKPY
jgi:hypothetical protein